MKYLIILFLGLFTITSTPVKKLIVDVKCEILQDGKVISQELTTYYQDDGKILSHFKSPFEAYLIDNRFGEMQFYSPKENSVKMGQDNLFKTEHSYFHNFLSGERDMGLSSLGYDLASSEMQGNILVSSFVSKDVASAINSIEIAYEGETAIYMAYFGQDQEVARRIYFDHFERLSHRLFPGTIVDITYSGPQDSTICRSRFSNFRINEQAQSELFEFSLPSDVRVLSN